MYCIYCGKEIADTAAFCPKCGKALNETGAAAEGERTALTPPTAFAADEETPAAVNAPEPPAAPASAEAYILPAEPEAPIEPAPPFAGTPESAAPQYTAPQYTAPVSPLNATPPMDVPAAENKNPKSKKKTLIALAAVLTVLVVGAAILVPYFINKGKASRFEEATALLDAGDHGAAKEVFLSLANYENAEEMALTCDYEAAAALMEKGRYADAQAAFTALGSFSDAAAKAAECQNTMAYSEAENLLSAGDFAAAKAAFLALGSYSDAEQRAGECQYALDFQDAMALFDAGRHAEALAGFTALAGSAYAGDYADENANMMLYLNAKSSIAAGDYENASELLAPLVEADFLDAASLGQDVADNLAYLQAAADYDAGKFYTAYKGFTALGSFGDAAAMAGQCIQPSPSTGEVYRNSGYAKKLSVTIKTPASDERPTYLKIYASDGTLVSTVFIKGGSSTKIKLPVGSYTFKQAYGDKWFGEEEMFGETGIYQTLLFGTADNTWKLSSGYTYTLTLRSSTDGNVGSKNQGYSDF